MALPLAVNGRYTKVLIPSKVRRKLHSLLTGTGGPRARDFDSMTLKKCPRMRKLHSNWLRVWKASLCYYSLA